MRMILVMSAMLLAASAAVAQDARILFLSKSAGFEHSVIKQENGQPSLVDRVLTELAAKNGAEITCTKDASLITAENLKNYDVVIFYTSGYLTETGTDGHPAMTEQGLTDLLEWIKAGGGFVGFHAASDTFHGRDDAVGKPYTEMIGGGFEKHGQQFKAALKVVSPDHPAIASLPDGWTLADEWYLNKNLNTEKMHVLALLEIGRERKKQRMYNIPDYPIVWCRAYGQGRVLYNGLGHREDVWESETFQSLIVDNVTWALGEGELDADPNYETVVPKTIPEN